MPALRIGEAKVQQSNDRLLPPADAGRDYAEDALTCWLEAQVAAYEIADVEQQVVEVRTRMQRAAEWFKWAAARSS